jgi:hypothetical protein
MLWASVLPEAQRKKPKLKRIPELKFRHRNMSTREIVTTAV